MQSCRTAPLFQWASSQVPEPVGSLATGPKVQGPRPQLPAGGAQGPTPATTLPAFPARASRAAARQVGRCGCCFRFPVTSPDQDTSPAALQRQRPDTIMRPPRGGALTIANSFRIQNNMTGEKITPSREVTGTCPENGAWEVGSHVPAMHSCRRVAYSRLQAPNPTATF